MPMSTEAVVGVIAVSLAVIPIALTVFKIWRQRKFRYKRNNDGCIIPMQYLPEASSTASSLPSYNHRALLLRVDTLHSVPQMNVVVIAYA
ncbi:hypothetical protein BDV12DRAFT_167717 [Aspergillus spectabilis]